MIECVRAIQEIPMSNSIGRVIPLVLCVASLALGGLALTACSRAGQSADQQPGASAATPGGTAAPAETAPAAKAAAPGKSAPAKPAPPPPPPPRTFTLAAGTVLAVQTAYTLSTEAQKAGEKFTASLAEPLVSGDWVVAKEGSEVEGLVVVSTKGGRVKGRAELEIAVTALTLADGQRIAVETAVDGTQAASTTKKDAQTIAITTGVGAAVGAIAGGGKGAAIGAAAGGGGGTALVLGTKGAPAEIPARSLLRFKVTRAVEIVEKK
jgi:hypothetical protein